MKFFALLEKDDPAKQVVYYQVRLTNLLDNVYTFLTTVV